MSSGGVPAMKYLVIIFIIQFLIIAIAYNLFYTTCSSAKEYFLDNRQLTVIKKKLNGHLNKSKCTGHRYNNLCLYSQSFEDYAIYTKFFSQPIRNMFGTYIELGALDGVKYSNTKFFEDSLLWSGLLIEANPKTYAELIKNRPNNYNKWSAICPKGQKSIQFAGGGATGGDVKNLGKGRIEHFKIDIKKTIEVPCKEMGEILKESNIKSIDFFSLDVEGAELVVLDTMDWSIPVKVFVIETAMNRDKIIGKMKSVGYKLADFNMKSFCKSGFNCGTNDAFVKIN